MRIFGRRLGSEDGFTMFTAMAMAVIVFILATLAFQISRRNLQSSGTDRQRLQAISAAEAGLDYAFSVLSDTTQDELDDPDKLGETCTVTQSLDGPPATEFTLNVTFYNAAATELDCSTAITTTDLEDTDFPAYALIESEGRPAGLSSPVRKMQAYVKLTPKGSGPLPAVAIMGFNQVGLNANTQAFGTSGNNADFYTDGNINWSSNSTINGNVYGQGSATLSADALVKGTLYVKGAVSMSGNSVVNGSVIASSAGPPASTISVSSAAHVYGDAKAAGTITAGAGNIDGNQYPNSAGIADPPRKDYPTFQASCPATAPYFCYDSNEWVSAGYTVAGPFTGGTACSSANTAISNWTSGSLVMRLTSMGSTPCTLTPPSKTFGSGMGSLAIFTDGPMKFDTQRFWTAASGTSHTAYLFVGLAGISNYCNFSTESNSGIGPGIDTLIYVPQTCTVDLRSNSSFSSGQVFGGTVNFQANNSFKYKQVSVPGFVTNGFLQDVLYKREVA